MLKLYIPAFELYDSSQNEFIYVKDHEIRLEHSLVSISKWEAKWHKSFINATELSANEYIDYIRCMTITQNVDPNVYSGINNDHIQKVREYIDDPMTATTFTKQEGQGSSREIITNEKIYYWMTEFNIPFECQKWHLNRLLTLIRVCSIQRSPKKKMSRREWANRKRALNKSRRSKHGL